MSKKFINIFLQLFFPTAILVIVGVLAWKNYEPGTILSGWDSLHPEFNFPLAFKRAFFGVWREEQGVGAIAAHAHMADLPRILFLWISSVLIDTNFLRYFYIFLCLLIGPLGVYFFLKHVFARSARLGQEKKHTGFFVSAAAALGALYYLLNLGTLQHFYLPFEMFNTQFAFLPWLFLLALKILDVGEKKNYLAFFILSILSSPMAYAPTLFYSYLAALVLFIFVYVVLTHKWVGLKRGVLVGLLVLGANAFWILPNLYSVKNQSETISESKINSLFSPEAFLRNKDYGLVSSVLIHKGFLFSWRAFDFDENKYKDLFSNWSIHLENPTVKNLAYGFAALSLLGFVLSLIKRNKVGVGIAVVGLFSVFFLFNENYIGSPFYKFLYENFGLFREGYRMPFTKFSILFMFCLSFFFGFFFYSLFLFLSKRKILKPLFFGLTILVSIGLIAFFIPAFEGDLISRVVKNKIPSDYFEAYKFLNQKEGRVAKFPMQTLYNWEYHNWGFEGSGWFSWFLSAKPQFDRDFDRWSVFNENFYREASFALYTKNSQAFSDTLEKYQVSHLVLDESVINAGGTPETLFIPEFKTLVEEIGFTKISEHGPIEIYETGFRGSEITTPPDYSEIESVTNYAQIDPLYSKFGNYIQTSDATNFPFLSFDKRGEVKISTKDDNLVFENPVSQASITFPTDEKVSEDFSQKRGYALGFNCDLLKEGRVDKQWTDVSVRYYAEDGGVSCDFFDYSNLDYSQAYILRIKGKNENGRSLKIYLYNFAEKRMNLEELLPNGAFDEYFVVYPKTAIGDQPSDIGGQGYSLNIETRSFGSISSENILEEITFYPFDLNTVTSVYQGQEIPDLEQNNLIVNNVKDLNDKYLVNTSGSGLLVLGQGYDEGWKAFSITNSKFSILNWVHKAFPWFFGEELEHVRVNSWANGWFVGPTAVSDQPSVIGNTETENRQPKTDSRVLIVFWPQYLEWGGLFLIVVTGALIAFGFKQKKV